MGYDKRDAFLKALLQGAASGAKSADDSQLETQKHDEQVGDTASAVKTATDFASQNPKKGITVGKGEAAIKPESALSDTRLQTLLQGKQADYSKRLEHTSGFSQALQDIEHLTNYDGKGGILTNPDQKLKSGGAVASGLPTWAISAGEGIGALSPGASEERKALERARIEYQKASSGMRVSDQARDQEKAAMGWLSSTDPALQAKGTRALAHLMGQQVKTIQSGYTPEVQSAVHTQLGGNPSDFYSSVYKDGAAGSGIKGGGGLKGLLAGGGASPPPGAADASPPVDDGKVDVVAPDGTRGRMPKANLAKAQARGYKLFGQ